MENINKETILSKIGIKDIIIALLLIGILIISFFGSPVDKHKSEIKKLHQSNDSINKDLEKFHKAFDYLVIINNKLENQNNELLHKLDSIDKKINDVKNEKPKNKNNVSNLSSDGLVDFFTKRNSK